MTHHGNRRRRGCACLGFVGIVYNGDRYSHIGVHRNVRRTIERCRKRVRRAAVLSGGPIAELKHGLIVERVAADCDWIAVHFIHGPVQAACSAASIRRFTTILFHGSARSIRFGCRRR